MIVKTKLVNKGGKISKYGSSDNIFSRSFYNNVRKRLDLTEKELPDRIIRQQVILANKLLAKFIIENPEGFMLKDMGVLAPSKHLPKELREDKEDLLERISKMQIKELRRAQILKRYNVDIGRRIDYPKLMELKQLLPHLNMNSYFYTYRLMWFNYRNTKSKKAAIYEFLPAKSTNSAFANEIWGGRDYYEWNNTDFGRHKISAKY